MVLFRSARRVVTVSTTTSATSLLQVADTLDRERLPGCGAVLVRRAEQLDGCREAGVAVVSKYLNLDAINVGQIDRDGEGGCRCLPSRMLCPAAHAARGFPILQCGDVDLDGAIAIHEGDGVIACGQDPLVE